MLTTDVVSVIFFSHTKRKGGVRFHVFWVLVWFLAASTWHSYVPDDVADVCSTTDITSFFYPSFVLRCLLGVRNVYCTRCN